MTTESPKKVETPDFSTVQTIATTFVEGMWNGTKSSEELEQLQQGIVVAALDAVYGSRITMTLAKKAMERFQEAMGEMQNEFE